MRRRVQGPVSRRPDVERLSRRRREMERGLEECVCLQVIGATAPDQVDLLCIQLNFGIEKDSLGMPNGANEDAPPTYAASFPASSVRLVPNHICKNLLLESLECEWKADGFEIALRS